MIRPDVVNSVAVLRFVGSAVQVLLADLLRYLQRLVYGCVLEKCLAPEVGLLALEMVLIVVSQATIAQLFIAEMGQRDLIFLTPVSVVSSLTLVALKRSSW